MCNLFLFYKKKYIYCCIHLSLYLSNCRPPFFFGFDVEVVRNSASSVAHDFFQTPTAVHGCPVELLWWARDKASSRSPVSAVSYFPNYNISQFASKLSLFLIFIIRYSLPNNFQDT